MNQDENNSASLTLGHCEPEDLLLYVLEMLTPDERQAMEAHLGQTGGGCSLCQQELTAVREEMGVFAVASVEATGMQSPPARSRDHLLTAVTSQVSHDAGVVLSSKASADASASVKPSMGLISGGKGASRSRMTAWTGWAVAAGIAIVATHFYQDREAMRSSLSAQAGQIAQLSADQARAREVVSALTDSSAQRVTLTLTKAPAPVQPTGRATYLANKGTLIFLASHLDPLPAGKTYELWVIPASGAAPVPAGTFRPDARGNANVVTAQLEGAGAAKAFGITIEPTGGSSTPTMPIVLAGS